MRHFLFSQGETMIDRGSKALACLVLLAAAPLDFAADKNPPISGWYNVFPVISPMSLKYVHPEIAKGKEAETTYSQSAHYEAATSLPRSFRVTLARDPDFKKKFSIEALKGIAAESQHDRRTVWTWADRRQVVVVLGDDKAVIITTDPKSVELPLGEYIKRFEFDRIEKALAKPPRLERELNAETFAVFVKGASVRGMHEWCGPSKHEWINKETFHSRWTFSLKDGSTVAAVSLGDQLESLNHQTADKTFDLFSKTSTEAKAEPAPAKEIPEKALNVLKVVDEKGEAPEGYEGGRHFLNVEKHLPLTDDKGRQIKYREWDVNPLKMGVNRGVERLITGSDGSAYYTDDHYKSFKKIR
jgi:guanyl-specific ribonuclease Sa